MTLMDILSMTRDILLILDAIIVPGYIIYLCYQAKKMWSEYENEKEEEE